MHTQADRQTDGQTDGQPYIHTHTRTHVHTYTYTYTYTHTYTHIYFLTCVHTDTQTHAHTHKHTHTRICIHACAHRHTHTHIYMYTHVGWEQKAGIGFVGHTLPGAQSRFIVRLCISCFALTGCEFNSFCAGFDSLVHSLMSWSMPPAKIAWSSKSARS